MKKHPLQNRTNVQIKGGGGQRPFEQCSKKLHFSLAMASLIPLITLDISSAFFAWLRRNSKMTSSSLNKYVFVVH